MKTFFNNLLLVCIIAIVTSGCVSRQILPTEERPAASENTRVGEWTSTNRQVTRGANQTAPEFNNISTCPDQMKRTDHEAGGGGDSSISVSEEGTEFNVNFDFGQGHKCK